MTPKIALLILAAGGSSRMKNHIKQLLPWNKSTFLEHAIDMAKNSQADGVFMVLGANFEPIVTHVNLGEITVIRNENWQLGIGSSIAEGVDYIKGLPINYDAILVCLADQPLMDSSFYNQLIKTFTNANADLVATNYGHKKGVPAIVAKKYFNELAKLNQDFGAQKLLNDKNALSIDALTKNVDIDTWEDYQLLLKNVN